MAMWGGRFSVPPDQLVRRMGQSISYDNRLYAHDVRGSVAHARMLARQGIISSDDADAIVAGLESIKADIDSGIFSFAEDLEDIHMNIESNLTKRVGEVGGKLHSGRSRNDQIATDIRLYLRDEIDAIIVLVRAVQRELICLAEAHVETILPGFTHLQHAQPVVLGHYCLAYTEMLDRDVGRLDDCRTRLNVCPLGSGAIAGTTLPIDRESTAKELGFEGICRNSMDATSDRDFAIEMMSAVSIIMMHLSRMSEDFVFWMSQEAGWIEFGDGFCTGSSLMPQKKNPDMCELTRGKTGRVYGNLIALLTIMKGIPLCYNRDMQEDKEPMFDSIDTVKLVLQVYGPMLATVKVHNDRMLLSASDPALMATDLAEWLVRHGVPFRQAHHRVGHLVSRARDLGLPLDKLSLEQIKESVPEATEECMVLWDPVSSVRARNIPGGTAPDQVRSQLVFWKSQTKNWPGLSHPDPHE